MHVYIHVCIFSGLEMKVYLYTYSVNTMRKPFTCSLWHTYMWHIYMYIYMHSCIHAYIHMYIPEARKPYNHANYFVVGCLLWRRIFTCSNHKVCSFFWRSPSQGNLYMMINVSYLTNTKNTLHMYVLDSINSLQNTCVFSPFSTH